MYSEVGLPGVGALWRSEAPADSPGEPSGEPQGERSDQPRRHVIAADGCADVILIDGELALAGPSTRWLLGRDGREEPVVGLRFAPGLAGAAFALDAADLRDLAVPARDALPGEAVARRVRALRFFTVPGDDLRGGAPLAAEYGARGGEFRRALDLDIGEGQVRWASRLRRAASAGERPTELAPALAAHEAGYADQAHLTRELGRIAGRTPAQLVGSGA